MNNKKKKRESNKKMNFYIFLKKNKMSLSSMQSTFLTEYFQKHEFPTPHQLVFTKEQCTLNLLKHNPKTSRELLLTL